MKTEDIVEFVKAARGRDLRVTGYRRSDGSVTDLVVRSVGSAGYKDLVRRSLQVLQGGEIANPGYPSSEWISAKKALEESWTKSLLGAHVVRQSGEKLVAQPEGFSLSECGVVLQNCVGTQTVPLRKAANSATGTVIKAYITERTPLGTLIGRVNLYEGKFDSLGYAE